MSDSYQSWFLADDFSGALEVGAILKQQGIPVDVVFDASLPKRDRVVVGFSSETRNAEPEEARRQVEQVLAQAKASCLRFKKIDSTMRGPVGAELSAFVQACPDRPVLFCPANASVGREVRGGQLIVEGVPVSQSSFRDDPVWPITEDCIEKILTQTGGPESCSITYVEGQSALQERLRRAWENHPVAIVDSASEAELEDWVKAAHAVSPYYLPCGSGGLARSLVASGALSDLLLETTVPEIENGNILFMIGSLHPKSREQIRYIAETTELPIEYVSLNNGENYDSRINALREKGSLILATQFPSVAERLNFKEVHRHSLRLAVLVDELFSKG
ncbi:MAG: hypothetical protein KJT03_17075, partial [Verrucomicrobiae bacterium]|nr:hypothetical protein [Verrucomicrobiae bacterium]